MSLYAPGPKKPPLLRSSSTKLLGSGRVTPTTGPARYSWSLGVPGHVAARAASSSATVRARTSCTVRHYELTSAVAGSIHRRTSWAKAITVLCSGVARAKQGVTYCTPQRNRMCGSGVSMQMRSKGLSFRGKVAMRLGRDLGDVPCLFSRRVKRYGKARRPGSSPPEAPSAARVLGAYYGCRLTSSGGGCRKGVCEITRTKNKEK